MRKFQPLLSAKVFVKKKEDTQKNLDILQARFESDASALVSIKWDGWRMFEHNGQVLCRSMDPPKNKHTQRVMAEMFRDLRERTKLCGLDGEAIGGADPFARNAMQLSTSAFNTHDSTPEFLFMAFDSYQFSEEPFEQRLQRVGEAVSKVQSDWPWLRVADHSHVHAMDDLTAALDYAESVLGAEGLMGRDPQGKYKLGRSTMKDGILWALKPYADGECVVESIHEMMSNQNEASVDSRGYTKRSGHKENMVPKGTFGYAICRGTDPVWPETFRIGMGPGLNDAMRAWIWANPDEVVGQTLKYKYQAIGCVDRPRQPKWMGLRGKEDMSK
jgi:DNA ligase-1